MRRLPSVPKALDCAFTYWRRPDTILMPTPLTLTAVTPRKQVLFLLLALSIYVLQVLSGNLPFLGVSNWLVPDGQTYHEVIDALATDGFQALGVVVPEQFAGVPANPVLFVYYYPFYVLLGTGGYFVANQLLVLSSRDACILIGFVLTPYFLLSAPLPSKDLMVVALYIPLLEALINRRWLWGLVLATVLFLVRDGAGVVAFGSLMAALTAPKRPRYRLFLLAAGTVVITIFNHLVYEYFSDAFIVSRNLQIAEDEGNFDLGTEGASSYLIRLLGNGTNLAFRPVLFDMEGNLPLLSLAYWISGVSEVVCLMYSIRFLMSDDSDSRSSDIALLFLSTLLIISLNPLVQPRYQLFFVVIMLAHLVKTRPSREIVLAFMLATGMAVSAAAAYVVSGIGLPAAYDWGKPMSFL